MPILNSGELLSLTASVDDIGSRGLAIYISCTYNVARVYSLRLRAHPSDRPSSLLRLGAFKHLYEVFLRLLRGIIGLGTSKAVHSCVSSSCKTIDEERLRTVLEVSYTELPLKVEAPRVKVAVRAQRHRVLRPTSHLFELQGVLLGCACRL